MADDTAAVVQRTGDYTGLDNRCYSPAKNNRKRRWRKLDDKTAGKRGDSSPEDSPKKSPAKTVTLRELRERRGSHYVRFKYPLQFHAGRSTQSSLSPHIPTSLRTTSARCNQPYRLRCQYVPAAASSSHVIKHQIKSKPLPLNKTAQTRKLSRTDGSEERSATQDQDLGANHSINEGDEEDEEERERNAQYQFVYQGKTHTEESHHQQVSKETDSESNYSEENVYSEDFDEENDEFEKAAASVIKTHEQKARPQSGRPESRKSGARPRSALNLKKSVGATGNKVRQDSSASEDDLEKRLSQLLDHGSSADDGSDSEDGSIAEEITK